MAYGKPTKPPKDKQYGKPVKPKKPKTKAKAKVNSGQMGDAVERSKPKSTGTGKGAAETQRLKRKRLAALRRKRNG